ncbi:MAG: DUF6259 domain-containing protein, partial [Blastocatellia bacterium]
YSKFHESSLLSNFSRKLFAPICPANQEWVDRTVEIGKDLLGYGPTGVIFDQVGGMTPYLCFDPSHGHSKPSMAFPDGRRKQLTALRKELKRVAPDFGFMTEQATDLYTQYVDVHHGIGLGFTAGENAFPQMFRYTFPDVIMTTRQPVPRVEARQVNHAFAYGLRFELEVRYRADMETIRNNDKPHLKEYLRQVSALRDRYWDLIGSGRFVDDRGVESSNSAVTVTGFEHDGRRAVVVWNNTKQTQTVTLNAPGYGLVEARGVEGALPHSPLILKSQQIAVLTYGK